MARGLQFSHQRTVNLQGRSGLLGGSFWLEPTRNGARINCTWLRLQSHLQSNLSATSFSQHTGTVFCLWAPRERSASTTNSPTVRPSMFDVQRSTSDHHHPLTIQCSASKVQHPTFDVQRSTFDYDHPSTSDVPRSTPIDVRPPPSLFHSCCNSPLPSRPSLYSFLSLTHPHPLPDHAVLCCPVCCSSHLRAFISTAVCVSSSRFRFLQWGICPYCL